MKKVNPKVLHVSTASTWRGGEQQLAYLYQELEALGVVQAVLCKTGSALEHKASDLNFNILSAKHRGGVDFGFVKTLAEIAQKLEVNLIHVHDAHGHTAALMACVLWRLSCKIIVSRRVDFEIGKSWLSRIKYNHKAVAKIICVSNKVKEIASKAVSNPFKLEVVHDGIDLTRFEKMPAAEEARKRFEIPNDKIIIGNIAAHADHKDLYTFIQTAALLNKHSDQFYFVQAGDGELKAELAEYAAEMGVENLSFLGFVDDVVQVIPAFDLFLFTSKTEGLGSTLLDIMAAMIPIVTTDAGGIPEIVSHQHSALVCRVKDYTALGNAVLQLISKPELAAQLIQNAGDEVITHSKNTMAAQTLAIYHQVLRH